MDGNNLTLDELFTTYDDLVDKRASQKLQWFCYHRKKVKIVLDWYVDRKYVVTIFAEREFAIFTPERCGW